MDYRKEVPYDAFGDHAPIEGKSIEGDYISRGYYDPDCDCVRSHEKHIGICIVCKQTYLKKHMVTVLARRRNQNPKTITHICDSCFSTLCERYEIEG